jgi:MaoC like domain
MTALTLPELVIEASPTFVISTAIATRDFQDVHHDRDRAVQRGSKDIFLNILTTTGLVQRFVTDWAGPQAVVRNVAIRLGAPCYAGDTLTFTGQAEPAEPAGAIGTTGGPAEPDGTEYLVRVTGRCRLGDHVTGTVRVLVPWGPA